MKDISLVERHFEKLAVVLVALLIGSYLAWDFLEPSSVKMGAKHPTVAPSEVNQILMAQASALDVEQNQIKALLNLTHLNQARRRNPSQVACRNRLCPRRKSAKMPRDWPPI